MVPRPAGHFYSILNKRNLPATRTRWRTGIKKRKGALQWVLEPYYAFINVNLISVVVEIDLYDRSSKIFTRAKEAFRLWDDRRRSQGVGEWDVVCYVAKGVHLFKPFSDIPLILDFP